MELLAPAGSYDALRAAVQSGADAVYIGGSKFSARRGAVNFDAEEIKKAADYCRLRGVKLHVAANILVKDAERDEFIEYMKFLNDAGVDAVIIQDIGMASVCRKILPDLPLHASTQMTVSNAAGARRMKELGFTRAVLARELSHEAIKAIHDSVDIELEVFAHGAICMSCSGQCLMSSVIGGRSGNRGMCAQPCRLPYEFDGKTGYFLSPKDMCMLERLSELKNAGVASLKIEGRLKRSEYVSAVCGVYRRCLDGKKAEREDIEELKNAFNRSGFTSGYFDGKLGAQMMSYKNPSNIAENIYSDAVKKRCAENANERRVKISISACLKNGGTLSAEFADDDGNRVTAYGNVCAEKAENRPLDGERLKSQLLKLGSTPFYADEAKIELDEGITIPVSEINAVRRAAAELLAEKRCQIPNRRAEEYISSPPSDFGGKPVLTAQVTTYEQARACAENGITEIYADTPLANKLRREFKNVRVIARLAPFPRDDRTYEKYEGDDILISNIGQYDEEKTCYGDFRLNIANRESARFYGGLKRITLSAELNERELAPICGGGEIIGYGRLPLMLMENCPLRALGKCQKGTMRAMLKDRKNESFPIKCNEGCTAELLNSKPIYLADKPEIFNKLKISAVRLLFTVENSAECGKIINEYKTALAGGKGTPMAENTFTRGHFFRGVD